MKEEFAKISSNPSFSGSLGIHYASLLEQVRVGSALIVGWNTELDIAWSDPRNRTAVHLYSVQRVRNCIVALIKRLDTEITSETISILIFYFCTFCTDFCISIFHNDFFFRFL